MSHVGARALIVCIILSIVAVNLWAVIHDLYFHVWWLDIPMHVIGGFWIGFTALTIIQQKVGHALLAPQRIWYAVVFSFGIGVLWEMYELLSDRSFAFEPYVYNIGDSIKDLLNDLIGGVLAGILGKVHQHSRESGRTI